MVDEEIIQEISEYAFEGKKKIKSVKELYDYSRQHGTGYHNYVYRVATEDGCTYEVTRVANIYIPGWCSSRGSHFEDGYKVRPWTEVKKEKVERRATIKWRAENAVVSKELAAVTVPSIKNDNDAVVILSDIHAAYNQLRRRPEDDPIFWELTECGIARRCNAIAELIGEEMVALLNLRTSQKRSTVVANYLTDGLVRR